MTKIYFELSIISPEGCFASQQDFENQFAEFLKTKNMIANRLQAKDRIAIEIEKAPDQFEKLVEATVPPEQLKQPKEQIKGLMEMLARTKQETPKKTLKIYKDSLY